jgi:hypothetical protein
VARIERRAAITRCGPAEALRIPSESFSMVDLPLADFFAPRLGADTHLSMIQDIRHQTSELRTYGMVAPWRPAMPP